MGDEPQDVRVHPTCVLGQEVVLARGVSLGAFVVVGDHVEIGAHARVDPGCYVGSGARIGSGCHIQSGATLLEDVHLAEGVMVASGAVVGSEGFGFLPVEGRHHKIPQVGTVEIGPGVQIGAGTCIDRGTTAATRIDENTELGSLVQIGHNVHVGSRCRFGPQVGIAGSSDVGSDVVLEASSGVGPHRRIGDGAHVSYRGGVTRDVPAGARLGGYPARPEKENQVLEGVLDAAEDLGRRLSALEERVKQMRAGGEEKQSFSTPDERRSSS